MVYQNHHTGDSDNMEAQCEFSTRVSGVMRVYWDIMKVQLRFPDRAPGAIPGHEVSDVVCEDVGSEAVVTDFCGC